MTPEERKEKLAKYAGAYDALAAFIQKLTPEQRAFKPAPEKWSAHQIIVHIADSEANSYVRVRKALAEPGGKVFGYDQDVWANRLDYSTLDWKPYLELFRLFRQTTYDLVKDMPEENWKKQYNHEEYGLADLDQWLNIYSAHVENHIKQIQRNLDAMGG